MPIQFSDDDKVSGSWIKWDVVGKKVQGTLIGRRQKSNDLKAGEMQWIYELLSEDGEIMIIGGRPGLDPQLSHVRLGQIIEIRYLGDKPSVRAGYSATKLLQVYTNKDAMDKDWLSAHPEHANESELSSMPAIPQSAGQATSNEGEIKVEDIPFVETVPTAPSSPVDPRHAQIIELAKTKLKVVNEADTQRVVMENLGLAYIASNLDAIIANLSAM
jgi:hypothetical protein